MRKVRQWATRTHQYSQIASKIKELSGAKVHWVKGHNDLECNAHEMLPQEWLNIVADHLAAQEFQRETNHKHKPAP